jgi:hypothetical protein
MKYSGVRLSLRVFERRYDGRSTVGRLALSRLLGPVDALRTRPKRCSPQVMVSMHTIFSSPSSTKTPDAFLVAGNLQINRVLYVPNNDYFNNSSYLKRGLGDMFNIE